MFQGGSLDLGALVLFYASSGIVKEEERRGGRPSRLSLSLWMNLLI